MHNTQIFSSRALLFTKVMKISLGIVAMAAAANISIPVQPVAITFGTLIVMAIGLTYSKGEALATYSSYLTLGVMGVPVFMNFGSGIAHILGPSGGYLLGYLLAAYTMAVLREKFDIGMLYNCAIGHMLIYIPGVLWLTTFIGMEAAIYKGFLIYIPTGILKIGLLVAMLKMIKR